MNDPAMFLIGGLSDPAMFVLGMLFSFGAVIIGTVIWCGGCDYGAFVTKEKQKKATKKKVVRE